MKKYEINQSGDFFTKTKFAKKLKNPYLTQRISSIPNRLRVQTTKKSNLNVENGKPAHTSVLQLLTT